MTYKTLTAKFASKCPLCNGRIQEGESVFWKKGSKAIHPGCQEPSGEQFMGEDGGNSIEADGLLEDSRATVMGAIQKMAAQIKTHGHMPRTLDYMRSYWRAARDAKDADELQEIFNLARETAIDFC